jgi:HEAT repeat protein
MFIRQLKNGETVFEKIEAARALKNESSNEIIEALKKRVLEDEFWGVSIEAVNVLGRIRNDRAYKALKSVLKSYNILKLD